MRQFILAACLLLAPIAADAQTFFGCDGELSCHTMVVTQGPLAEETPGLFRRTTSLSVTSVFNVAGAYSDCSTGCVWDFLQTVVGNVAGGSSDDLRHAGQSNCFTYGASQTPSAVGGSWCQGNQSFFLLWNATPTWTADRAFLNLAYQGDASIHRLSMLAIPEPSTWALMLAGLSGIALVARRRRRA